MSDNGYPVPVKYLRSLAYIIARRRSSVFHASTTTDEAINPPGKNWPQAFYKRHPELKPKKVKALDWNRHDINIYDKITHWFEVIGKELHNPVIQLENVYNMDETEVMLSMLGSIKVFVGKDDPRDYRGAVVKQTMVTAIEFIFADGTSLLPLIISPASTHRSNRTTYPTLGWHYACSESGYTDSKIRLDWPIRNMIMGFNCSGTHESLEILEYCFVNNVILCRIPSHTSHKLQPCINTVGKEHFTSLYSPSREKALTSRNIISGWIKAGLYPFNPDSVLRDMPKPLAELTTPVTVEALMSLRSLIEQDAHTLDETSKQRLQKLANAAQNSESKCRKSTKSTIVGKAKVMSYEGIVGAQAKRAAKEAAKEVAAVKGKRGRKRKSPAPARAKVKKARRSEAEVAEDETAVAPFSNSNIDRFKEAGILVQAS
ncbi:hypothetical protein K469DRAFT_779253 [Zopfia rhizophila CBS 207.26]|uniref:DDE-1 domain-containing protein n=1 Tax=Zopfia rhizophila CBS 207.26 TaxID=1314779 RepID=A0A6A6E3I8_9PEZI|nr:hypothetical protein K469DRAFT_779253 [Zopfia rhizophila CBS 207.26]